MLRSAKKSFSKPRLKSFLTPSLHKLLGVALVLAVFMLANTVYLLLNRLADKLGWTYFAVGETSLPKLFQAMILTHTGAGLLLVVLMLAFAIFHLPKVWQRREKASIATGIGYVVIGLTLAITGLFILTAAATRHNSWAWWVHVGCALLVPLGYILHRLVSYTRPQTEKYRKFWGAVAVAALALVVVHGFTKREINLTTEAQASLEAGMSSGPGAKNRDIARFIVQPFDTLRFVPAGFVPPSSPFFPSAATTTSGGYLPSRIITRNDFAHQEQLDAEIDKYGFVKDNLIGAETCIRCHQDIVEQWATSAHRFSSFNNPFYEATINDMRANALVPNFWVEKHAAIFLDTEGQVGNIKSKWCSACHDPALMLAGKMNVPVDRNSPEAQAGLTCLSCHAIDKIHNTTGNGNYNIADEQEDPYLFPNAKTGSLGAYLHDAALKAKPTVHKRQMLKPFFKTSEFCASCHKVSLPEPVNNYRWLRGQNEYDNWHDSGVALNASRTFYLPAAERVCQDCHMPLEPAPKGDVAAKNGYVKSHRFLAVNTALPFLRDDQETIDRIEAFLRDEKLSVDIFALKTEKMSQPIMALDKALPHLPTGEKVTVDVVVRNKGVGHTFPGGTNDSNEGWLEFSLTTAEGDTLAISGFIGADGHLDPMAHTYKAVIVDRFGQPIHRRNAQDIYVMVYASVIGPGTADIAHYEFTLPPALAGRQVTMQARLLWRKFDREYTEFAYRTNPEGFKKFDRVPDLPVTEIASAKITLAAKRGTPAATANAVTIADWMRFNDYGIGLLLEGDTRGATQAFEQVVALRPDFIEGPLNLAKTAVRDGHIQKAYTYLQQCEDIEPANARVAWVWGVVLQDDGRYPQAVKAYRRVLEDFPQDRAAWRNLGRTYYLDQQYEEAIAAFNEVLKIDAEDRIAHYHKMLCYRALGDDEKARAAEAAYEFYRIDESAQELTREYKRQHPGANIMAQAIKTHKLEIQ